MQGRYNVLFVCTGNLARSILAEAITNHRSQERFHGYSVGSDPKGFIYPQTLEVLRAVDLPIEGLKSKGWNEFLAARRTGDGFRHHRMRPSRRASVSRLAGRTGCRTLEHSRPGQGYG